MPKGFAANTPKYTGCCVFEAAADFCNGWLIPWSWSLKLAQSEISLKRFANERYLYGVARGVSSPWMLDPVEVIKGCWRGTTYLQKGIRLVAWHQWSGIHWLEAISHVATKALNTSRSHQRRAGRGAAQLGYAMWCSHPAGPCRTPSLGSSSTGHRNGTLCLPLGGASFTPPGGQLLVSGQNHSS